MKNRLIVIIFAISLVAVGFAGGQSYLRGVYQRQAEAGYRRALSEFATHLQGLAAEMERARIAVGAQRRSLISSNIRRLVYAAQGNIGELPLGGLQLERIARLLAGVYEQTYSYAQQDADDQLENLFDQIEYVNHELQQLLRDKEGQFPWVSWHEYFAARTVPAGPWQALAAINDGLQEFKLSFGGGGEIKGERISPEDAIKAARAFSEAEDLNFLVTNESKGNIPAYTVEGRDEKRHLIFEVSQKGGMVLWMVAVQDVGNTRLALAEIVRLGADFLQKKGFPLLHVTDAQLLQNRAIVTFVPKREGVLRYAEPIRILASAEDGSILGFWATPYYVAQSRGESQPLMARDQSWAEEEKIRSGAEVLDRKLALIVNEQQREVLVKRLGVRYQEKYYLIYLNAATGEEEMIVPVNSPEFF